MKVFVILSVQSLELNGRLAKVGYKSLEIGLISLDVIEVLKPKPIASSTMKHTYRFNI